MTEVGVRRPRLPGWWIGPLYLAMGVALLPWIGVLLATLPDRAVSPNYRLAWVGFDVMLVSLLTRTAWLAWHRSPFVVNVASASAMLLIVDAWFDVTTSPRGADLMMALLAAAFVELPTAALSIVIARRAQHEIARTGAVRRPWPRWWRQPARDPGESPANSQLPLI